MYFVGVVARELTDELISNPILQYFQVNPRVEPKDEKKHETPTKHSLFDFFFLNCIINLSFLCFSHSLWLMEILLLAYHQWVGDYHHPSKYSMGFTSDSDSFAIPEADHSSDFEDL